MYLTGASGKSEIPPLHNQPVRDSTYLADCPDEVCDHKNCNALGLPVLLCNHHVYVTVCRCATIGLSVWDCVRAASVE